MANEIYAEIILDLYKNPANRGIIEDPDVLAEGGNPSCGDHAIFMLKINNGVIEDAKFSGNGCAISVASDSILTELIKGKKVSDAKKISPQDLFSEMGNIIQTRIKCATLGLIVLKKGLEAYEKSAKKKAIIRNITI
ncbi:MAG: SUF system NifU family Fe-S cluster assembly protein [archaeon]|nr:SUF system NifU family Fe-S cluster assembly protein [archaeon]